MINNELLTLFGSPRSIPTTFIFDKNLILKEKVIGYQTLSFFEDKINPLR